MTRRLVLNLWIALALLGFTIAVFAGHLYDIQVGGRPPLPFLLLVLGTFVFGFGYGGWLISWFVSRKD